MGKMEINPDKLYEASSRLSKLGAAIQQQITTLNEVGKGVEKGWKYFIHGADRCHEKEHG